MSKAAAEKVNGKHNGHAIDDPPPGRNRYELSLDAAIEAERCFVAAMLWLHDVPESDRPTIDDVPADDFLDVPAKVIYKHLLKLRDEGKPLQKKDDNLLWRSIKRAGDSEKVGGLRVLREISNAQATAAHVEYYAREVREAAEERRKHERVAKYLDDARDELQDNLPPSDVAGKLVVSLESVAVGESGGRIEYETISLADLKDVPIPEYYIAGILAKSQPGVIAGQYKSLKTTAAVALSYSLVTGCDFLGHFPVSLGAEVRVGMFSGEAGRPELSDVLQRIAAFHGDYDPWQHDGLKFSCDQLPKIGSKPYMEALVRWIEKNRLNVCIIDPGYAALAAAVGDGAGNYYKVAELLFQVTDLQRKTGCVMLLCPHMTKAPKYDPPMLSDIAWSGFSEWSGQWLLLGKRREWDDQAGQHWLWLVAGGRSGHASTWGLDVREGRKNDVGGKVFEPTLVDKAEAFGASIEAQSEQRERQVNREQERAEEAIRQAFHSLGSGHQIKTSVLELTGTSGRGRAVTAAWAAMMRRGEIRLTTGALKGGNNKPCDGYSYHPTE